MIKKIKGILLFLVSLAIAASLLLSPSTAVTFLPYLGITLVSLAIFFVISGVMNLLIGLTNARWNAIWFVPYLLYTGLFWLLYASTGFRIQVLQIAALLSLLTAYLVLDIAADYKEYKIADNTRHGGTSGRGSGNSGRDGLGSAGDIPVSSVTDKKE